MQRILQLGIASLAVLLSPCVCFAQITPPSSGGGGAPSGPAGGVLSGTYPNPGFGGATAHNISAPLVCAAASGSGTAYTCTTSPSFTPADGDVILFQADVASTGAMTLNVNSTSAAPVKKQGGTTAIVANDFIIGQDSLMEFDGTNWQMQGQTGNATGGSVFPVTVSGTVTSGGIPYFSGTTAESSSALLATNALVVGGGAGGAPATGNGDFTYATHTLTGAAAGILDLSATSTLAGLKLPSAAGAVPTADSFLAFNTTNHTLVSGSNGTTIVQAAAATGTNTSTTCTNQAVTVISGIAAPTCTTLTSSFLPAAVVYNNGVNTATTAMTLDLSGSTVASAFKVPVGAGLTSAANGVVAYDTTAGNTHLRTNGADSLAVAEAAALTANFIPKATDSTHSLLAVSLLSDNATTLAYTGTGGITSPIIGIGTSPPTCTPGSGGAECLTEGTAATAASSVDDVHADSTQHALEVNNNNTGEMPVARTACVNVTPVTVAANVTSDQNLQACSFSANLLNVVGRTLRVYTAGVFSTAAASVAALTFKVKLCTISGCGSGTVIAPISTTTGATSALTASNLSFSQSSLISTQTAGASSAYESHGFLTIDLSATAATSDSLYQDTNAATVGTIDSTGAIFLQVTVAASAGSTSNSFTARQLVVDVLN